MIKVLGGLSPVICVLYSDEDLELRFEKWAVESVLCTWWQSWRRLSSAEACLRPEDLGILN